MSRTECCSGLMPQFFGAGWGGGGGGGGEKASQISLCKQVGISCWWSFEAEEHLASGGFISALARWSRSLLGR